MSEQKFSEEKYTLDELAMNIKITSKRIEEVNQSLHKTGKTDKEIFNLKIELRELKESLEHYIELETKARKETHQKLP